MRTKQELKQRLADLQAKKAAVATVSQPEAPAAEYDAETEARAKAMLEAFRRKDTTAEAAGNEPVPVQTVSMNEREFQILRSQKAAEERASVAEKKVESLEQTLTFILDNLSTFIVEQTQITKSIIESYVTPAFVGLATSKVLNIADRTHLALKLFAGCPTISDVALNTLGVDDSTVVLWKKWRRAFDAKPAEHWLEKLWAIADGRLKTADSNQPEFIRACLEATGLNIKQEIERIHHEKAKQFFQQSQCDFGERGRSFQQSGKQPEVYIEPASWRQIDLD